MKTGIVLAFIMLGVGLYLTLKLRFFTFTHIGRSIKQAFSSAGGRSGGITAFQAMTTALGGSIGTANIAGVALAIAIGGPGAVFWMWIAALLGMATKFAEIVLAVQYRHNGHGGAMYYIERGLGRRARPLAICFSVFGMLSALVGTALVQANTAAFAVSDMLAASGLGDTSMLVRIVTGIAISVLTGIVILGGSKRIGRFSERIVPFMAAAYIIASIMVISANSDRIATAFGRIFSSAFQIRPAAGGAVWAAISCGVSKGIYSNEAGIGSAPMVYAEADGSDPVRQGMLGIFEVFIDTIVMCTLTALVILTSDAAIPWGDADTSGTAIALNAFSGVLPRKAASAFLAAAVFLFAFTSIVGWSLYGIRCAEYLFGKGIRTPFRIAYLIAIPIGAVTGVDFAWKVAETLNYLMAIPNVIAVAALSKEVKAQTDEYKMFENRRRVLYNTAGKESKSHHAAKRKRKPERDKEHCDRKASLHL